MNNHIRATAEEAQNVSTNTETKSDYSPSVTEKEGERTSVAAATGSIAIEPASLDPRYAIYWQHRSQLIQEQSSSQTELDKSILNLSLGALGASVAVITALNGIESRIIDLDLVFISWFAFCVAIVSTTESFNSSLTDYDQCIRRAYTDIFGPDDEVVVPKSEDAVASVKVPTSQRLKGLLTTQRLNDIARISFYLGIAFLLIFVGLNLIEGKAKITDATILPQVASGVKVQSQGSTTSGMPTSASAYTRVPNHIGAGLVSVRPISPGKATHHTP